MKPKRLSKKEFIRIYKKVPRLTIELIIRDRKGILLTKRLIKPYKNYWHIPGGTILLGELIHDAIHRTAKDELGIEIDVQNLIGIIDYGYHPKIKELQHTVGLAFLIKPLTTKFNGGYQAEEIKYFKNPPKRLVPAQLKFLKENNLIK